MTIKEANSKLEKVDNDIEYWLQEKERLFIQTQPAAVNYEKEVVSGGKRVDRFLKYEISLEEKKINEELDKLYAEKIILENYIDKELKRLHKYSEIEQLIIYYKEQSFQRYTWQQISQKVHYSVIQCKRIYKRFKQKRDID